MSADKRSVHTDALETLGTILTGDAGRDAIHLAVEPVVAGEDLHPGDHIGIENGFATTRSPKKLGIVDPFIQGPVYLGQRFWLVVYPRTITSLRHVWSHPDFGDTPEAPTEQQLVIANKVASRLSSGESEAWITNFAENDLGMTYNDLMEAADAWVDDGEYTYENTESYKDHYDKFQEFWEHYEKITGRAPSEKGSFFTCSC